ncbi:YebC/PmpR family DNA-binding transcriptional regulator [Candidatus Peregrinibacteria bacterium]|nr:YebC/PmpR family DNA-binding transcriptional regulator [Candidatus Peregrinibacteria bacterium]
MSGHSKWHSIKHKKGLTDAARGKVFTRHANLITIAAKRSGDPDTNPSLRLAIENAKKDNVPNANIERAIKRGTGELKDSAEFFETVYEGYGPVGIAVIVECVTNNKNRTFSNLRTVFDKKGGNIGASGSVTWMFKKMGVIEVALKGKNPEEAELMAIDAGAEDIKIDGDNMEVYTPMATLHEAKKKLESQGLSVEKADVKWIAQNTVKIETKEEAKKTLDFIDTVEEDEDVSAVASNFDIPESILNEL